MQCRQPGEKVAGLQRGQGHQRRRMQQARTSPKRVMGWPSRRRRRMTSSRGSSSSCGALSWRCSTAASESVLTRFLRSCATLLRHQGRLHSTLEHDRLCIVWPPTCSTTCMSPRLFL